jgi:hypothetical protein
MNVLVAVSHHPLALQGWRPYSMSTNVSEEWRPVVGYEGYYSVSNLARVRRDKQSPGTRAGYILSTPLNSDGYPHCCLHKDGVRRSRRVHQLVAIAFLGQIGIGQEVNHKNGIRHDCRASNLEYVTRSGNIIHSYRHLNRTKVIKRGTENVHAKLTESMVRSIRAMAAEGGTYPEIAAVFAISRHHVGAIVHRKRWAHVL